jgi:putative transcriptional regulator
MSDLLNIAHDMGKDLFEVGAMDKLTKRQLDTLCLPVICMSVLKKLNMD